MANSWQNPRLATPIRTDVPELQEKLIALLKQDPTPISDIPSGAKRLYEASSGKWQWQLYNGSSWAAVPFLQHNVDQLDGYHAAITPAANTVAVRNASGLLEDSITGNAATASSAATLSETLPVNKGGTGATTSEAARSNLGVPPTSHTSTATTYGAGNATQYGHLKLSDATNSSSGVSGGVAATPAAVKAAQEAADAAQTAADNAQTAADNAMTKASTLATASTPGIVKPGTGMTVDAAGALNVSLNNTVTSTSTTQAATASAVKTAYDKAVEADGKAGISKIFNSRLIITESNAAWTPPATGWARVTVIGGGGGGAGGYGDGGGTASSGGGGDSGEYVVQFMYLREDSSYAITIGAGGAAGPSGSSNANVCRGRDGGQSCFQSLTASGGMGGFRIGREHTPLPANSKMTFLGQAGAFNSFPGNTSIVAPGGIGGGAGYGRGGIGAAISIGNAVVVASSDGVQGAVIIEYYDPDKEAA